MGYFAPILSTSGLMYCSDGTTMSVGPSSNARSSMLPAAAPGTSLLVPANRLKVGATLRLTGYGIISAANAAPGSFTCTPTVTPAGGAKTDLGGLTVTPLIGVVGVCAIDILYQQTATGILTSGTVNYGMQNGNPFMLLMNGAALIVASDPTVDRTFGVDGKWQTSNAANYVTSQAVIAVILSP